MEFCSCEKKEWKKTRVIDRVLVHGACGKPLACNICKKDIPAINLGAKGPECESCSLLFSDEFFDEDFDIEKNMLDGFIYHAGGVRVSDLLAKTPDFENADYYFESDNVS
jgi:hypothetical protein